LGATEIIVDQENNRCSASLAKNYFELTVSFVAVAMAFAAVVVAFYESSLMREQARLASNPPFGRRRTQVTVVKTMTMMPRAACKVDPSNPFQGRGFSE